MPEPNEAAKRLGLNEYESRAFFALNRLGTATASQLSKSSGIPWARIYDVLAALERRGCISIKPARPLVYESLPVASVIRSAARTKKAQLENELAELEMVRAVLEREIRPESKQPGALDSVRLIEGRKAVYEKIAQQFLKSKENVLISTTQRGAKRKAKEFEAKLKLLKGRGVKVDYAVSPTNPRFVVFDKKHVLLFLGQDSKFGDDERALLISAPALASFFASVLRK